MEPQPPIFLDVPTLLEQSEVRHQGNTLRMVMFGFVGVMFMSIFFAAQSETLRKPIEMLSTLVMLAALGVAFYYSYNVVRKHRAQQDLLQSADELMQLRRWPDAAVTLQRLLSEPARLPQIRVQGLIFLSGVLARYHRFEDAIKVYNHLLENVQVDPGTGFGLRLARVMAMLHEDHLFDADRAISELRRMAGPNESGGLALVEIYRDVKTGHPAEAIEMFDNRLDAIRSQLGHRLGDAYALVAKAYDLQNRPDDAQRAYERATLLQPVDELQRRYNELASLAGKYKPAAIPEGTT